VEVQLRAHPLHLHSSVKLEIHSDNGKWRMPRGGTPASCGLMVGGPFAGDDGKKMLKNEVQSHQVIENKESWFGSKPFLEVQSH